MIRAGVPQSVAMRISGQKTAAVFTLYDITSEANKVTAQAALPARVASIAKGSE